MNNLKSTEEHIKHSGTADKVKGSINEVIGGAKSKIGEVIHNDKLRTEGNLQQMKGKAQHKVGDVKNAVDDIAHS